MLRLWTRRTCRSKPILEGGHPLAAFPGCKAVMRSFIGIDFGTTSIKASAIDEDGHILARVRIPCSTVSPEDGWFEVDAEKMWRSGLESALRQIGRPHVSSCSALCVSSVCASFVPVDDALCPLYNAILYGIDTRAADQVVRFNRDLPPPVIRRLAGTAFTSHSVLPKLLWLKERRPDIYESARYFLQSTNFVTAWLTGEVAWDLPSAAGGHMVDLEVFAYPTAVLESVGLDQARLPPLKSPLDILGNVTAQAAHRTGLPEGTPVLVGACDINAEAFACAAVDPGEVTFVYGSTISTLFVLGAPRTIPGFIIGPSVLTGTYRAGGATSSGGRFLDWVRSFAGLTDAAVTSTSRPSGILMIPYLDGARTPHQKPGAKVAWYGMSSATKREDLLKAAMESMGCEMSIILDRFTAAASLPSRIHAMGGLCSNREFLQLMANVTGMPQSYLDGVDASHGDALMALSSSAAWTPSGRFGGSSCAPGLVEMCRPTWSFPRPGRTKASLRREKDMRC